MKKRSSGFWIGFILTLLAMLALLELCRNTTAGFVLLLPAAALFVRLRGRAEGKGKRALCWLGFLALFAAVLFVTKPPVRAVPAVEGKESARSQVVVTRKGKVQGLISADGAVEVFAGIPYAKPPVGELRWREPQDPDPWEGMLACDHFAPQSMQPVNSAIYSSLAQIIGYHDYKITPEDNYVAPVSEDSLYVNVWKPSGEVSGLPVYVFIHGGSLQTGQPWYADYSGLGLAREGVIVVNMGYRLGVFGYFADEELAAESPNGTTGNYGLLDQIKALEWVRDNIAAFGGDPDNVTLAGESAGAASVSALCTSPLAKGLFRRVVLESSTVASAEPPHSFRTMDEALESGRALKARYGVSSIAELRALSADKLVGEAETQHHMTIDGYALVETPYESYRRGVHNEEAILHGYNSAESGPFILFSQAGMKDFEGRIRRYFGDYADEVLAIYPAATDAEAKAYWAEIYGAIFFDYPHYCLNRLAVENGIPVWEYYFSKTNGRLGPWHSGEEVYCYGNIPAGSKLYDARDRELSAQMLHYWANFASNGDPNGEGLPFWDQNIESSRLMEFGDETQMIDEREHALFAVLDRMQGF
ncbi:MAG: carboxylesterase family protein [Oscillospiraceae bacterium]|nr:carboxylesterase family protein [Oscillospiraceae bacterium]